MFSKGKKQSPQSLSSPRPDSGASGTAGGVPAGAGGPAKRQSSGVPSIVSADLRIEGNLHSIGDVQIDGVVNGDIASKTLTIGEGAEVHGAIEAESLRICGTVEGEVTAKSVILTKTARVYGDVLHETLSIEAGALIHGFCKRLDAPQKRSLPSPGLSNGIAAESSSAAGTPGAGAASSAPAASAPAPAE